LPETRDRRAVEKRGQTAREECVDDRDGQPCTKEPRTPIAGHRSLAGGEWSQLAGEGRNSQRQTKCLGIHRQCGSGRTRTRIFDSCRDIVDVANSKNSSARSAESGDPNPVAASKASLGTPATMTQEQPRNERIWRNRRMCFFDSWCDIVDVANSKNSSAR